MQAFFLFDIGSADGTCIPPASKSGWPSRDCPSSYDWPHQRHPPASAWHLWARMLHYFEQGDKLLKPLGNWITPMHQVWKHFVCQASNTLYLPANNGWTAHQPLPTPGGSHITCSTSQHRYSPDGSRLVQQLPPLIFPVTIQTCCHSSLITLNTSSSPLPPQTAYTLSSDKHILNTAGTQTPHPTTSSYLPGTRSTIHDAIDNIGAAMADGILHICADRSFIKEIKQDSHAWVFSTTQHQFLWRGAGPSIGHPNVMSPYWAELSGLTSVLFVLHWVCNQTGIETESARIYCDNISALDKVFTTIRHSTNPLHQLAPDIDLLTCAQDLLLQLPVDITISEE